MPYQTRLQLRTRLNLDLGLSDDTAEKPWGDEAVRDEAIRDGFERLWPQMRRMQDETQDYENLKQTYDLTKVKDVQLVEVVSSDGVIRNELKNWRNFAVDDDPVRYTLRLSSASAPTSTELHISGYAPYFSQFTDDADPCDLEDRLAWIPLVGARAWLYRRRYHEYLDYEQHANLNRVNAMDPPTLFTAYQDAEARFQQALEEHHYEVSYPRRSRVTGR